MLVLRGRTRPDLLNPVFGLPTRDDLPRGPEPSANERYWVEWFVQFSEINASIERLSQALVYLSHYPRSRVFRFHRLSEASWLRYHIEAYLQEAYILVERLKAFLKRTERTASRCGDPNGRNSARKFRSAVDASFKNIVQARAGHVHKHRFEDEELRNLDTLVLLTASGKMGKLRPLREARFIATLEKWRRQLNENNKVSLALCATIFTETTEILKRNEPLR